MISPVKNAIRALQDVAYPNIDISECVLSFLWHKAPKKSCTTSAVVQVYWGW
jgi:hypothetical protein